jgi:hypothetical protein
MPSRYFQPSYSQQYIPTYTPLPMENIVGGLQSAERRYDQAIEASGAYETSLANMRDQIDPVNMPAVEQMFADDQEFLSSIAAPGGVDYRDALPALQRRARQRSQELQPYIQDSAIRRQARQDLKERFDEGRLSSDQYRYEISKLQQSSPLTRDEQTGDWQFFQPRHAPDYVDIPKVLDEFMKDFATQQEVSGLLDTYEGRMISRITRELRAPDTIRDAALARLMTDPNAMAYMRHELEMRGVDPNDTVSVTQTRIERDPETGEETSKAEQVEMTQLQKSLIDKTAPHILKNAMVQTSVSDRINPKWQRELDDYTPALTAHINLGRGELSHVSSPGKIRQTVEANEQKATDVVTRFGYEHRRPDGSPLFDWEYQNGRIVSENPVYTTPDGRRVDMSPQIAQANAALEKFESESRRVQEFEQKAMQDAGAMDKDGNWLIPQDQMREFERLMELSFQEYKRYFAGVPEPWQEGAPQNEQEREAMMYDQFLTSTYRDSAIENIRSQNPKYAHGLELMKKRSSESQHLASLTGLTSSAANTYMNNYFRNLAPDHQLIDAATGQVLNEEDREGIKYDKSYFIAPHIEEGGNIVAIYRGFIEEGDDEITRTFKIAAPSGLYHYMRQAGNWDNASLMIYEQLHSISDDPLVGASSTVLETEIERAGRKLRPRVRVDILPVEVQQQTGNVYRLTANYKMKGETVERSVEVPSKKGVVDFFNNYINQLDSSNGSS